MPRTMNLLLRRKSKGTWFVEGPLVRCMGIFDLTVLGLGGILDAGIYVVIGQLALRLAGPAVIISFLIAAVAAVLTGLCYAELSSRITKTGSAYVFTYVILGELLAFITGWSMIAEYVLNAASMARSFSGYINSLTNASMYSLFTDKFGWGESPVFGEFPDFTALLLVVVAAVIVGLGVRESKTFMDSIAIINWVAIVFAIICGCVFAEPENVSSLDKFAPNGISGILMAAPSCFYFLTGFDAIPTASEEALDPRHGVPAAILSSLMIGISAYLCITTVLTLMIPYSSIVDYAPLAEAFMAKDFVPGYYIVSIGALCAVFGSLLATTFAVTRLVYSIAYDGLISSCFAGVSEKTHVPTKAVLFSAILTCLLATFIHITFLVELVSIAAITTFTMVSLCVLLSRYQTEVDSLYLNGYLNTTPSVSGWLDNKLSQKASPIAAESYEKISRTEEPVKPVKPENQTNQAISKNTLGCAAIALIFFILCLLGFWTSLNVLFDDLSRVDPVALSAVCIYGITSLLALAVLHQLPKNKEKVPFMVPMVVPIASIIINTFMLVRIHWVAYVMFFTWAAVGLFVYFTFGFYHSIEAHANDDIDVFMEYPVVPGLPKGTEVIWPVQEPLKRNILLDYKKLEGESDESKRDASDH